MALAQQQCCSGHGRCSHCAGEFFYLFFYLFFSCAARRWCQANFSRKACRVALVTQVCFVFNPSSVWHWWQALAANPKSGVRWLSLQRNGIGDSGAAALAGVLRNNSVELHKIDLHDNDIGLEGATDLAEALQTNSTLQVRTVWFGACRDVANMNGTRLGPLTFAVFGCACRSWCSKTIKLSWPRKPL